MYRFLPGLILLQIITVTLIVISADTLTDWSDWVRVAIPLAAVTVLIAFWFGSIALDLRKDEIMRMKENHAKEREKIRVNAERAKQRASKDAQSKANQEIRRSTTKANVKMGAAMAGTVAVGGFLLLSQFLTLGVILMATAGGGLGGYVYRIKQEHTKRNALDNNSNDKPRLIGSNSNLLPWGKDKKS